MILELLDKATFDESIPMETIYNIERIDGQGKVTKFVLTENDALHGDEYDFTVITEEGEKSCLCVDLEYAFDLVRKHGVIE